MSSSYTRVASTTSSPFTQAVVSSMRKLYPESLADKSFDNTGLLLEAPCTPSLNDSVLLTIDLTNGVADEAIQAKHSVVVSYHPIIFRGLKSFTLGDSQQRSLLRLAAAGISVYSPHTAVDAAEGGLGDWLADIASGDVDVNVASQQTASPATANLTNEGPQYALHDFSKTMAQGDTGFRPAALPHTRKPITPHPTGSKTTGMGRLVTLSSPRPLSSIVTTLTAALHHPRAFHIALPSTLLSATASQHSIRTIAVCAGSGGSVFSALANDGVDLLLTGEMSHHETLAAVERGQVVVTLLHSNSERAYLGQVMRGKLEEALQGEEWDGKGKSADVDVDVDANADGKMVVVSEVDRDPHGWAVLEE